MVKQSKNKVKLKKKYKAIGRIPIAALRKIQEVMELPDNVQTIRANSFGLEEIKKEAETSLYIVVAPATRPLAQPVC